VLELVKRDFKQCTGRNLPVYKIAAVNLRDFHTIKKDLKKGLSRLPPKTNLVTEKEEEEKKEEGFSPLSHITSTEPIQPRRG
jgi:hypothetical protein